MQNDGGASAQPQETDAKAVQKRREREYNRMYIRAKYGTVCTILTKKEKAAFRDACRRNGKTVNAVLGDFVKQYMLEQKARELSFPPVAFG